MLLAFIGGFDWCLELVGGRLSCEGIVCCMQHATANSRFEIERGTTVMQRIMLMQHFFVGLVSAAAP